MSGALSPMSLSGRSPPPMVFEESASFSRAAGPPTCTSKAQRVATAIPCVFGETASCLLRECAARAAHETQAYVARAAAGAPFSVALPDPRGTAAALGVQRHGAPDVEPVTQFHEGFTGTESPPQHDGAISSRLRRAAAPLTVFEVAEALGRVSIVSRAARRGVLPSSEAAADLAASRAGAANDDEAAAVEATRGQSEGGESAAVAADLDGLLAAAVVLVRRFEAAAPLPVTAAMLPRLLAVAYVLAAKALDDHPPRARLAAAVCRIPCAHFARLEVAFAAVVGWRLLVTADDVRRLIDEGDATAPMTAVAALHRRRRDGADTHPTPTLPLPDGDAARALLAADAAVLTHPPTAVAVDGGLANGRLEVSSLSASTSLAGSSLFP